MLSDSLVLWTETQPGVFAVDLFDNVAVVTTVAIVIVHAPTDQATRGAQDLRRELVEVLLTSGLAATRRDGGTIQSADPTAEPFYAEPDRQKLLVLVCDGAVPLPGRPWFAAWQSAAPVLPVMPAGSNPTSLLPSGDLSKINVGFWSKAITESVPAILSLTGLTTDEHRVFISYRRVESQPLAEQLFDRLTHEGFEVFLDRFSIAPGIDFQRRLNQELADKAMVVLLESAWISSSKWTQHEIDYTKRFRLGLLALRLPGAGGLPSIDADLRVELVDADFDDPPLTVANPLYRTPDDDGREPEKLLQWRRLEGAALDRVVGRIKWTHDQAIFRRRYFLRDTMIAALKSAQVQDVQLRPNGLLVAEAVDAPARYSIWMTTRPPDLPDFHTTEPKTLIDPKSTGVIIGPTALLETGRLDRLHWLRNLCKFRCLDEADIADAAQKIKEGTL